MSVRLSGETCTVPLSEDDSVVVEVSRDQDYARRLDLTGPNGASWTYGVTRDHELELIDALDENGRRRLDPERPGWLAEVLAFIGLRGVEA